MPRSDHNPPPPLRLRRLRIENYKRLDSLTVEFPRPRMPHDLDITVLGSQNGGGKTSVIECVGLLFLAALGGDKLLTRLAESGGFMDISDLLIKSGRDSARIIGTFEHQHDLFDVYVELGRRPTIHMEKDGRERLRHAVNIKPEALRDSPEEILASLLAMSSEPTILPPLLHFNSYRKVQEGNPNLAMMAEDYPGVSRWRSRNPYARQVSTLSAFKATMLRSMLGRASLFEGSNEAESVQTIAALNRLLRRYANGTIEKLRPLPDNSFGFRIQNSPSEPSFAFDGLSSGQKEIVSTLFLIWTYSKEMPLLVLIDEPELHLNAEWHADFIEQLRQVGPSNQYIIATHSEQIFRSVDASRRALLIPN